MKISIPTGTIKSKYINGETVVQTIFQFLLVRLKDSFEGKQRRVLPIFQFLLVRLKALCIIVIQNIILFQFLLVRLKVSAITWLIVVPVNFNSYWYD